jgi:hypothetical protein
MAMRSRWGRFLDVQNTVRNSERRIRWNDIDVIGSDPCTVLGVRYRHACVRSEKLDQRASMMRIKMLHENEAHATLGGHVIEEGFESCQAASRCADAHDEIWFRPFRRVA